MRRRSPLFEEPIYISNAEIGNSVDEGAESYKESIARFIDAKKIDVLPLINQSDYRIDFEAHEYFSSNFGLDFYACFISFSTTYISIATTSFSDCLYVYDKLELNN